MLKVEAKLAKKQNELKRAKYKKKLQKMTMKKNTLDEALRVPRDADLEVSDSSNSSSNSSINSSDEEWDQPPNQTRRPPKPIALAPMSSAAPQRRRSKTGYDRRRAPPYTGSRARSRSFEHSSSSIDGEDRDHPSAPPLPSNLSRRGRDEDSERYAREASRQRPNHTWNWAQMMRQGLRSLHSRNDSVRMKDSELIHMGKRSAVAYFNIECASSQSALFVRSSPLHLIHKVIPHHRYRYLMKAPGPRFSVMGHLQLLEEGTDVWFNFVIDRQHQLQVFLHVG